MSSLKKCPKCDTWNEDKEYCTNCNELLDYWKIREQEVAAKEKEYAERPLSGTEQFFLRMKTSRFFPIRWIYYFFYSIWVAMVAIVSFFMYMVAAGPG